jgi:hypothetical protein
MLTHIFRIHATGYQWVSAPTPRSSDPARDENKLPKAHAHVQSSQRMQTTMIITRRTASIDQLHTNFTFKHLSASLPLTRRFFAEISPCRPESNILRLIILSNKVTRSFRDSKMRTKYIWLYDETSAVSRARYHFDENIKIPLGKIFIVVARFLSFRKQRAHNQSASQPCHQLGHPSFLDPNAWFSAATKLLRVAYLVRGDQEVGRSKRRLSKAGL